MRPAPLSRIAASVRRSVLHVRSKLRRPAPADTSCERASQPFTLPSEATSRRASLSVALVGAALLACTTAAVGPVLADLWVAEEEPQRLAAMPAEASSLPASPSLPATPLLPVAGQAPPASTTMADAVTETGPVQDEAPVMTALAPTSVAPPAAEPPPAAVSAAAAPSASLPATPAQAPPLAPVEPVSTRSSAAMPPMEHHSDGPFAGIWAPNAKACSPQIKRQGLLPAVINSQGAWAGETTCAFNTTRRVGNTWHFAAVCSDTRTKWKANVRMVVNGNRLTWTSQRGTQSYVRCQQGLLRAHNDEPNTPAG